MNRTVVSLCSIAFVLATGIGCTSSPKADEAKKTAIKLDKIQGKAQLLIESGGAMDAVLNAGSTSSVYIWGGTKRYRLFLRTPVTVTHGEEYIVEGVFAQKVIDEIGDPDQGQNGYPLPDSCRRVITTAWSNLAFDAIDLNAQALRFRINRYPARPVFLVKRIQPVSSTESAKKDDPAKAKDIPEVKVPAAKQRALLIQPPPVQTAPLWDPKAESITCGIVIDSEGKVAELDTGKQLCEFVDWSQYRYQPPVQGGKPVKVDTEVEVRFEPRKPVTL
jgi:hypothetical protein